MTHLSSTASSTETLARLELIVGRILRIGVVVATVLLVVGLALWVPRVEPTIALQLLHAGLITLMLTPVLRVVVSVVEFARARDWFFMLVTLAVLAVLGGTFWAAMLQR
ncbi:MAG: DUF1634 domain-containing protein [Luteitalea sp.]|nr:DUF1634 domain-containing protein [Luteitalea sp.]